MRFDEVEAALYSVLETYWTATPLAWHNVDERNFGEPGQPLLPDGDEDFVSVRLDIFPGETITVPGTCVRYSGQLAIGICVKERTGTRQAKTYLSDLCELLENQTVVSSVGEIRLSTLSNTADYFAENGWYVLEGTFALYFERYLTIGTLVV